MNASVRNGFRLGLWIVLGLSVLLFSACKFPAFEYNNGYDPVQPIPFSHKIHAGQYHIACLYCHTNAVRGRHATVPSLNICMNCHIQVDTSNKYIQEIQQHYAKGIPIVWKKVNMLPDFVHFNHAPHIKHGFKCQTCHGPIETMSRVYQVPDLSMGWCIHCHRKKGNDAPTTCSTCHY